MLPGASFTELIAQYSRVTGKLNQVYLGDCSNVFAPFQLSAVASLNRTAGNIDPFS